MPNPVHLARLRRSVNEWNAWRQAEPGQRPDLSGADLSGQDLQGADLSGAWLHDVKFCSAKLAGANFAAACLDGAVFAATDFRQTQGLDLLERTGRLSIDLETLFRSRGSLSPSLLSLIGVPESHRPLFERLFCRPPQYGSCFISYASPDAAFARLLHHRLSAVGVATYFDEASMRAGEPVASTLIQRVAEREHLVVVLSQHALQSRWVATEVACAIQQAQLGRKDFILPVRLDQTGTADAPSNPHWLTHLRDAWHIADFSAWELPDAFERQLVCLLERLARGVDPA
jgi:hypothetical protein